MSSYCIKLSFLEVVGLICTHLPSCCMVGAIYSRFHDSFGYGCDGRRADFDQHGGGRRAGFYN